MSGARRESTPERPMGDVLEFAGVVAVITGGVMVWRLTNVWIRRLSRPPESGGDLVEVQRHLFLARAATGASSPNIRTAKPNSITR